RERMLAIVRLVIGELAATDPARLAHARLFEACCTRQWPGNVRELRSTIRLAATTARAANRDIVRAEDLPAEAGQALAPEHDSSDEAAGRPVPATVDKAAIAAALARAGGVVSVAARALGLHRTQLYRLMDKLGIARDE
ncbi:MAG: two component, sigma54 specific, transcriptional regulator, Fis family protein, partial [Myxococcales bacterium]|nr:two component, sigma54 specific, transcriptional regulator, Fis family protein [Myxococcales bacterium]